MAWGQVDTSESDQPGLGIVRLLEILVQLFRCKEDKQERNPVQGILTKPLAGVQLCFFLIHTDTLQWPWSCAYPGAKERWGYPQKKQII